jgi:ubiquinol-cytochrome c reductase cytochrome c1 subunit
MNYCMGCHSLQYMRYNRMAEDLGIDETTLRQNLIFGDAKPGDLMTNSMRPEDGEKWFGTAVPDLTLVTRWRSPDWVYTYLKSFYTDRPVPTASTTWCSRPWACHTSWRRCRAFRSLCWRSIMRRRGAGGDRGQAGAAGLPEPDQYDAVVRDITAFLTYVGEPVQLERQRLGIYVLLFLGLLFILAYALKKEFWKDVH